MHVSNDALYRMYADGQIATEVKFTDIHPSMWRHIGFCSTMLFHFPKPENEKENVIEIDRLGLINCKRSEHKLICIEPCGVMWYGLAVCIQCTLILIQNSNTFDQ